MKVKTISKNCVYRSQELRGRRNTERMVRRYGNADG